MDQNIEVSDDDREEILRLVLSEAGGKPVEPELERFPKAMRSRFRNVVCEAGLVRGTVANDSGGELRFGSGCKLTEKGKKRLAELNSKRG